jgi:hypothetical protein
VKAPHFSSLKFCIGRWQRNSSRFRTEFATPIHPICIANVLSGAFFFFAKDMKAFTSRCYFSCVYTMGSRPV